MPKPARKSNEVDAVKEQILDAAQQLILQKGLKGLSMRKLAARVSMTAANIYNYYSNKDELYLALRIRGFEQLTSRYLTIREDSSVPIDRLTHMVREFVRFGIENAAQYEILFGVKAPKYLDYVGTSMEPAAWIEKQTSNRVMDGFISLVQACADDKAKMSEPMARYKTIRIWSALHGAILLYNSRLLHEVVPEPEEIIKRLTEDVITSITIEFGRAHGY